MQNSLKLNSNEVKLLGILFSIMTALGYSSEKLNQKDGDRSIRYEKVLVAKLGTCRLVVFEVNPSSNGRAVTFSLTFDPANKLGLVFNKYLEQVVVKLVAVFMPQTVARECVIEAQFKDPNSKLKSNSYYILNTDRNSGMSNTGKVWLTPDMQISVNEALVLADILKSVIDN